MIKQNIGTRVSASELALALGITRQHLTRLCRAGGVPGSYRTKGGHWRFRWVANLKKWTHANQRRGRQHLRAVSSKSWKLTPPEVLSKFGDVVSLQRDVKNAISLLKRRQLLLAQYERELLDQHLAQSPKTSQLPRA